MIRTVGSPAAPQRERIALDVRMNLLQAATAGSTAVAALTANGSVVTGGITAIQPVGFELPSWQTYRGRFARRYRGAAANLTSGEYVTHRPSLGVLTRPLVTTAYRPEVACLRYIWEAAFEGVLLGDAGLGGRMAGFGVTMMDGGTALGRILDGNVGLFFTGRTHVGGTIGMGAWLDINSTVLNSPAIAAHPLSAGLSLEDWNKYEIRIVNATGAAAARVEWLINDSIAHMREWGTLDPITGLPYLPVIPHPPLSATRPHPWFIPTMGNWLFENVDSRVYVSEFRHIAGDCPLSA